MIIRYYDFFGQQTRVPSTLTSKENSISLIILNSSEHYPQFYKRNTAFFYFERLEPVQ